MAEAAAPADGTSSTPPASTDAPAPAVASATDASPETTPTSEVQAAPSVAADPAPAATQDATPPAPAPLFTIPETVKLAPEAVGKFDTFLRSKLVDGKVTLTSQEIVDQFLEQAQDANARWLKQVQDIDKENEQVCKDRYTPAQLAAAETAVGFFSSFEPAFRDFAKRQLNDPVFVNAMRLVGERLSEDTFEIGAAPAPQPSKKSAAERMGYAKPKPN